MTLFLDGFFLGPHKESILKTKKLGHHFFKESPPLKIKKRNCETGKPNKKHLVTDKKQRKFCQKKSAKIWTPASAPTRTLKHWITVYKTPMPEKIAAHSWHSFLGKDRIFGSSLTVKCTVTRRPLRQNSMSSSPCCCFNNNTGTLGNWQLQAEQASAIEAICGVEIFLVFLVNRFGKRRFENKKYAKVGDDLSTVDGWNPKQPPGMYETLKIIG